MGLIPIQSATSRFVSGILQNVNITFCDGYVFNYCCNLISCPAGIILTLKNCNDSSNCNTLDMIEYINSGFSAHIDQQGKPSIMITRKLDSTSLRNPTDKTHITLVIDINLYDSNTSDNYILSISSLSSPIVNLISSSVHRMMSICPVDLPISISNSFIIDPPISTVFPHLVDALTVVDVNDMIHKGELTKTIIADVNGCEYNIYEIIIDLRSNLLPTRNIVTAIIYISRSSLYANFGVIT